MNIPTNFLDLFSGIHFAHVATINPDGSPQITPVWVDYDKTRKLILFNTAKGRKKARNLKEGSKIALTISDSEDPYRYISVQGIVFEITEDGALDHIISLAQRYFGRDFKRSEGEVRLKIAIEPKYVSTSGN